jgi:uncharacterized protein YjbJ (UPF0337 family)
VRPIEVVKANRRAGGFDLGISASGQPFARSIPPLKKTNVQGAYRLRYELCNWERLFDSTAEVKMRDINERGLENEVKGTVKETKGKIRGDLGDATDDMSEHIKGRAEELEGKAQKNFGKGERNADSDSVY